MITEKTHPKLYKKYIDWTLSKVQNHNIPPEILSSLLSTKMIESSLTNPGIRALYDFMDENSIEMFVHKNERDKWTWVCIVSKNIFTGHRNTRIEAEQEGFQYASDKLEERL